MDSDRGVELVGHSLLDGQGDCMGVQIHEHYAYVGHMGQSRVGTSIVDVSDPSSPQLLNRLHTPAGTRSHKVQVVEDLLLVNYERDRSEPDRWVPGLKIYDISDPENPSEVGFLPTPGKGVHRMTCTELPYVYMSGSDEGFVDQFFMIVDISDPSNPVEVGRWWWPGMNVGGGEVPSWPSSVRYAHHHSVVRGDRAYAGWWDAGFVILDISDPTNPHAVAMSSIPGAAGPTHTTLAVPERELLIVGEEALKPDCDEPQKHIRMFDISDEAHPRFLSKFPVPKGDFCGAGGMFGPHNLHEMKPGMFESSEILHATYFNAGLRVYDTTDPSDVREIASCVPPAPPGQAAIQLNDLMVDADGLIYATDRFTGGLYIMQGPTSVD